MNKRNSQNERLDRIGRNLLEATKIRNDEIEKIVAAPQLFDSVKARIKAGQYKPVKKSFFGDWRNLSFWNWQRISTVSAALFFLVLSAVGIVMLSKLNQQVEMVFVPEIESNFESFKFQDNPQSDVDLPNISQTKIRPEKSQIIAKQFVRKIEKPETKKSSQRINVAKNPKTSKPEPDGEFYALAYAGHPVEKGEVLQIVRAELSPSSLFALGVNLPIENAPDKIKTDLLVGSDGVARAIRFVE
jgi:hypothetical protein